jgi:hypothetical protein
MTYDSLTEIANQHSYVASVSKSFVAAQNETTFLTPSSGLRLRCTGGYVSTAATSGRIFIHFRDSGEVIADLYPNTAQTYFVIPDSLNIGREDDPILITTTTSTSAVFISLNLNQGEEHIEIGTSTSTTTSTTTTMSTSTSTTISTSTTSTSTTRSTSTTQSTSTTTTA